MSFRSVLDTAIRNVFSDYQTSRELSVDDILVDPDEAKQFAETVNRALSAAEQQTPPTILRRLISLRKLGQSRGGLPRAERAYRGRRLP